MSDEKRSNYGMVVSGMIMSKNKYPGKNGNKDRFAVDVAIPGIREMLSIQVPPEKWGALPEMGDFKTKVSYRKYNGQVYFEAVD